MSGRGPGVRLRQMLDPAGGTACGAREGGMRVPAHLQWARLCYALLASVFLATRTLRDLSERTCTGIQLVYRECICRRSRREGEHESFLRGDGWRPRHRPRASRATPQGRG